MKRTQRQQHGSQTGFHKFRVQFRSCSLPLPLRDCELNCEFYLQQRHLWSRGATQQHVATKQKHNFIFYKNETQDDSSKYLLNKTLPAQTVQQNGKLYCQKLKQVYLCTFLGAEDRDVPSPAATAGGPVAPPWATAPTAALGPLCLGATTAPPWATAPTAALGLPCLDATTAPLGQQAPRASLKMFKNNFAIKL